MVFLSQPGLFGQRISIQNKGFKGVDQAWPVQAQSAGLEGWRGLNGWSGDRGGSVGEAQA